jgi:hypothetical protein
LSVKQHPVVEKPYSCDELQLLQATNRSTDGLGYVVQTTPSKAQAADAATPCRVEPPRPCDGIGRAISNAYARDLGLPQDMAVLLAKLNDRDPRCHW